MQYGTKYTLTIGDPAVDTDGTRLLQDYVTTFTTVSIGLRATALIPASKVAGVSIHSQIAVIFDGPLDPAYCVRRDHDHAAGFGVDEGRDPA